jgi:hypothetical protein
VWELEFLAPATVALVSAHPETPAVGVAGGGGRTRKNAVRALTGGSSVSRATIKSRSVRPMPSASARLAVGAARGYGTGPRDSPDTAHARPFTRGAPVAIRRRRPRGRRRACAFRLDQPALDRYDVGARSLSPTGLSS